MSCQVLVEFKVKPDAVEAMRRHLVEVLPDTRAFEGCIEFNVIQDLDDPTRLLAVEQWESCEAYEAYLQWRDETGAMDAIATMMDGEPSIRYFSSFGV